MEVYRAVVEVLPNFLIVVPINRFIFERSDSFIGIECGELFVIWEPREYASLCNFAIVVEVSPAGVWLFCPNRGVVK